jgi:gamma-glutamyltranspeptidase / glutathione hydrolase
MDSRQKFFAPFNKFVFVFRIVMGVLLAIAMLAGLVYLALPNGPRDPMTFDDPWHETRPAAEAHNYMVVTGTTFATQAAEGVLDRGGNAFDAAVAALLMLNVTHGEAASFPGIAPLILYDAKTQSVHSYVGAGTAPAAATIDFFKSKGYSNIPDLNILAQLIPASPDVIVALLEKYGTMSFSELAAPAIQMARQGFPVSRIMAQDLDLSFVERIGFAYLLPYNTQVYLYGQWWRPLYYKDRLKLPDLANTLQALSDAEQAAVKAGGSREAGLQAVRDYFYKGPIADEIVAMHKAQGGLFTAADLANYSGYWEEPLQGSYGDYTFYTNGTWNQGIVVPMALQILEGIDLKAMGQNSAQYVHTVDQAIELAMADREAYVADPKFVKVPVDVLLSKAYAAQRRQLMTDKAFGALPPPGNIPTASISLPLRGGGRGEGGNAVQYNQNGQCNCPRSTVGQCNCPSSTASNFLASAPMGKDTTHLAIIDRWGNSISLTPSDFPKSPMVPGTGLTLGNRMTQFYLDPNNVDTLQPGKRPRVTPQAVIVFKDGKFFMSFGTPGDDMQTQALVQVFLNMQVFGMDIQQAIDAPRFRSMSMPATFAPHVAAPGTLWLETSLYNRTALDLQRRGYHLVEYPDWDNLFGAVGAVIQSNGTLTGGSDPREETWAAGK